MDLAAEAGGNVETTVPGQVHQHKVRFCWGRKCENRSYLGCDMYRLHRFAKSFAFSIEHPLCEQHLQVLALDGTFHDKGEREVLDRSCR